MEWKNRFSAAGDGARAARRTAEIIFGVCDEAIRRNDASGMRAASWRIAAGNHKAIEAGRIPVRVDDDGKKYIDPAAADVKLGDGLARLKESEPEEKLRA
jgi:hypothetical protein